MDLENNDFHLSTCGFGGNNRLLRYGRNGRLLAQVHLAGSPLLGLAFDAVHWEVYVANFGASKIHRVPTGRRDGAAAEEVADILIVGAPADRIVGNPVGSMDTISFGKHFRPPKGSASTGGRAGYSRSRA